MRSIKASKMEIKKQAPGQMHARTGVNAHEEQENETLGRTIPSPEITGSSGATPTRVLPPAKPRDDDS